MIVAFTILDSPLYSILPAEQETFAQTYVKPKYDEGCIFMYQTL